MSNDIIQVSPSFRNDNWSEGLETPGGVFPSPNNDFNTEDGIDWSIAGDDITTLKIGRNVVHAVVRITHRIYMVLFKGYKQWGLFRGKAS